MSKDANCTFGKKLRHKKLFLRINDLFECLAAPCIVEKDLPFAQSGEVAWRF